MAGRMPAKRGVFINQLEAAPEQSIVTVLDTFSLFHAEHFPVR
jgi:hypothetical protein